MIQFIYNVDPGSQAVQALDESECEKCRGMGFAITFLYGDTTCDSCYGTGCEDTVRPMFQVSDDQKIYRKVNAYDFVCCPKCNKSFSTNDKKCWTGLRHRCGQKIGLESSD